MLSRWVTYLCARDACCQRSFFSCHAVCVHVHIKGLGQAGWLDKSAEESSHRIAHIHVTPGPFNPGAVCSADSAACSSQHSLCCCLGMCPVLHSLCALRYCSSLKTEVGRGVDYERPLNATRS